MAVTRADRMALIAAGLIAVGVPALVLGLAPDPAAGPEGASALLAPAPPPAVQSVYTRDLFAAAGVPEAEAPPPADAPQLVGIVGRIGSDAVALVRGAGGTRSLAIGESVDGWTLEALSIDAAAFTRGGQRIRVPLPAGEAD